MNKTGIIILGIIFGPLIIIGMIKLISFVTKGIKPCIGKMKWSWLKIGSPWKIFGKLLSTTAVVGLGYLIFLAVMHFWPAPPTPEQLTFKESSKNLAELELEPEKAILKYFGEKIDKKEMPTENEKRAAMEAEEKIKSVRKEYSEGKLAPPLQKAPAKPKEEQKIEKKLSQSLLKSPHAVLERLRIINKNKPPVVIKSWVVPCRIKKLTDTELEIVRVDKNNAPVPGTERRGFRELSDAPDHYSGHWQSGKNHGEFWTNMEYGKGADSDKIVKIIGYENKDGGQFDVKVTIK